MRLFSVTSILIIAIAKEKAAVGNKLMALWAAGYYTLTDALKNIITTVIGVFLPAWKIATIAAILSNTYAYVTKDYVSLAWTFMDLITSFIPGLSTAKLLLYAPKIIAIL